MALLPRTVRSLLIVVVLGVLFANSRPASADAYSFTVFAYPGAELTLALGTNNHGDIFGHVLLAQPLDSEFLYQNGNFSIFRGIVDVNDSGMILANTPSGPGIFFQGQFTPLNVPGGVIAFNNTGTVLVTGGFVKNGTFTPINYPGSSSTTLRGINDLDEVVGDYIAGGQTHGFLYKNGAYTTIDFPTAVNTHAYAINNNGVIVGNYFLGHTPLGTQGFTYENGNFQTVNGFNTASDETGTFLTGINDFGVIVGYELEDFRNLNESFIATPVPEPGTLGLMGCGLLAFVRIVRRRSV